jgi:hypothetical protein
LTFRPNRERFSPAVHMLSLRLLSSGSQAFLLSGLLAPVALAVPGAASGSTTIVSLEFDDAWADHTRSALC